MGRFATPYALVGDKAISHVEPGSGKWQLWSSEGIKGVFPFKTVW